MCGVSSVSTESFYWRSPGIKRNLGISKPATVHLGTDSWPKPSIDAKQEKRREIPRGKHYDAQRTPITAGDLQLCPFMANEVVGRV